MRVLLLSGGGFKGAVQVPVVRHLIEKQGIHFDLILGVSVGSINGVLAAQEDFDTLEGIWGGINTSNSWTGIKGFLRLSIWRQKGIYSLSPLHSKLKTHASLSRLKTKFGCGITIRETGQYFTITNEDMPTDSSLHSSILGSSAIAGLMEPVVMKVNSELRTLSDGGHRHVIPKPPSDATEIVVVCASPVKNPAVPSCEVSDLKGAVIWMFDMMLEANQLNDIEDLRRTARSGTKVTVYAPNRSVGGLLDADRETIRERFAVGREMIEYPVPF